MRDLRITGLAQETRFANGTDFDFESYLVVNDGEIRIPLSKEATEIFLKAVIQDRVLEKEIERPKPRPKAEPDPEPSFYADQDDSDEEPESDDPPPPEEDKPVYDEDGIGQI